MQHTNWQSDYIIIIPRIIGLLWFKLKIHLFEESMLGIIYAQLWRYGIVLLTLRTPRIQSWCLSEQHIFLINIYVLISICMKKQGLVIFLAAIRPTSAKQSRLGFDYQRSITLEVLIYFMDRFKSKMKFLKQWQGYR